MSVLRRGNQGRSVSRLQRLLNYNLRPSPNLAIDGDFGSRTQAAVEAFQRQAGIRPTGVADAATMNAFSTLGMPEVGGGVYVGNENIRWMQVARQELGVTEVEGRRDHHARILEYHQATTLGAPRDETHWCSSFANWVMKKSGMTGTKHALARSWLNWGVPLDEPRYGAITVFQRGEPGSNRGHVGFFAGHHGRQIQVLGGNQGSPGSVCINNYATDLLLGYRWPIE